MNELNNILDNVRKNTSPGIDNINYPILSYLPYGAKQIVLYPTRETNRKF